MADTVYVYHSPRNYEAADAFVATLRESGGHGIVSQARSDRWGGETLGDLVYHDGSNRALAWAHEAAGVPIELFGESLTQPEREAGPVVEAPEAAPPETDESAPGWPEGYYAERSGSWYSVFAPDGTLLGKERGEAGAIACAREHAGA